MGRDKKLGYLETNGVQVALVDRDNCKVEKQVKPIRYRRVS